MAVHFEDCVAHCLSPARSQKADNPSDAAFDAATRLLAFEGKATPGERELTVEERALEQQQHAERLERARRQRMLAPAGTLCAGVGCAGLLPGKHPACCMSFAAVLVMWCFLLSTMMRVAVVVASLHTTQFHDLVGAVLTRTHMSAASVHVPWHVHWSMVANCLQTTDTEVDVEDAGPGGGYAGRRKRRAAEMEAAERAEEGGKHKSGRCCSACNSCCVVAVLTCSVLC